MKKQYMAPEIVTAGFIADTNISSGYEPTTYTICRCEGSLNTLALLNTDAVGCTAALGGLIGGVTPRPSADPDGECAALKQEAGC